MIQKIVKLILVIFLLWIIIFFVNIFRVKNYKEPIAYINCISDGWNATYTCLGYKVNTSYVSDIILKTEMFFGNYKLFETEKLEYEYDSDSKQLIIIE